jgi:uncharacterized protein (TIGR03086 family)
VDLFQLADAQLLRIVSSLPASSWRTQTPADLTVLEVVNHLVAGNVFAGRLLAGASAQVATADLDGDQLGDDPLAAVAGSCEAQRIAFAEADQAVMLHHPSGDISYQTFVRFRLGELVVHAWDLAIGTGQDATLEPLLVGGLWQMVEPHLDEMRAMGTFGTGASGSVGPDAAVQDQLLDAFGRKG